VKLYYTYRENRYIVEDTLGKDGPYSGYRETSCDWELLAVMRTPPRDPYHSYLEFEGELSDRVFCVVARYSDGDTFSTTTGLGTVAAMVGTRGEAEEIKEQIEKGTWEGYSCWGGYFNSLEGVTVERQEVE
jgi:hypothetical protein